MVVYGGKPYFSWITDASGVWRKDPWGGGALLRYLPPVLESGMVWKQESGGKPIWFHLTRGGDAPCWAGQSHSLNEKQCWTLQVLGPGELLTYRWAEGYGPTFVWTVNAAKPSAAFRKEVRENRTGDFSTAQRAAFLGQAPPVAGERAAVEPAAPDAFEAARVGALGLSRVQADFDGDGSPEQVQGLIGQFTFLPVEFLDGAGRRIGSVRNYLAEAHKVDLVRFAGSSQTYLQLLTLPPDKPGLASIGPVVKRQSDTWEFDPYRGRGVETTASRITASPDGLVTVEWDMGDPARHTRVRQYRFTPQANSGQPLVRLEAETFRPQGAGLTYPTDPQDVLQAAFVARWFAPLNPEVSRYFAAEAGARALLDSKGMNANGLDPGVARFATITEAGLDCFYKTAPAKLGPDNSAPFVANWGGGEWGAQVRGKVTFTKAADGRTVIDQLVIENLCEAGH